MANSPWCGTGYGTQSKHLLPAFKDMACVDDVLIHAYFGLQGGRIRHRIGKHTFDIWPTTTNDWGNETISKYAQEWNADLVITLLDIWPLAEDFGGGGVLWCPYAPVDLQPVPDAFVKRLRNAYLPIVYAKHAQAALEDIGIESAYAPHGVLCSQYRPMPQMRGQFRAALDWPEEAQDGFVFGMVAANKGFPCRKAFPEVFEAFARVMAKRDDVWLYLHTTVSNVYGGPDLVDMARAFGIGNRVIAANQHLLMSGAYDDTDMVRIYNAIDCLLSPSYSEGFGLPQLEAQSCGTPVIATDAFAMTELNGAGWLVPWDHQFYMPIGGSYVMPSVDHLAGAMFEALVDCKPGSKTRKALRAQARAFALDYDWPHVIDTYWRPILERLHRELTPRTYRIAG